MIASIKNIKQNNIVHCNILLNFVIKEKRQRDKILYNTDIVICRNDPRSAEYWDIRKRPQKSEEQKRVNFYYYC